MTLWRRLRDELPGDIAFHYALGRRRIPAVWWGVIVLVNPALRAVALTRLAAYTTGLQHQLWRNALLTTSGCDIGPGVRFEGPVSFAHPVGIVIGSGVVLGARVQVFQHVTIGRNQQGGWPVVGDDAVLYAGCVVAGPVRVGAGAVVGANAVITRDVPAGQVASR